MTLAMPAALASFEAGDVPVGTAFGRVELDAAVWLSAAAAWAANQADNQPLTSSGRASPIS